MSRENVIPPSARRVIAAVTYEILLRAAEAGVVLRVEGGRLRREGHGRRTRRQADVLAELRRHKRAVAVALEATGTEPGLQHAQALAGRLRSVLDALAGGDGAAKAVLRGERDRLRAALVQLFAWHHGLVPSRGGSRLQRQFCDEVGTDMAGRMLAHVAAFSRPGRGSRPHVLATQPYTPPPENLDLRCMLAGWRLWRPAFPSWWAPGRTHLVVLERTHEAGELAAFRRRVWREVIREATRGARP